MQDPEAHALSIGAVSKLTSIPSNTIRTWERRHQVVRPRRDDGGRRVYTMDQVRRLAKIAALAERGERVADLAQLDLEQLAERLALHEASESSSPASPSEAADTRPVVPDTLRVASLHPAGAPVLGGSVPAAPTQLVVVAEARAADELPQVAYDLVIADLSCLGDDPLAAVDALRSTHAAPLLITFHFAPRPLRHALRGPDVRLLQGPSSGEALRRAALEHVLARPVARAQAEPARQPHAAVLSRPALERLVNVEPELGCECPNHLAALTIAMREFELYSHRCASDTPADEELHADLALAAGRMRAELEQLVLRVCAHDGIPIPD